MNTKKAFIIALICLMTALPMRVFSAGARFLEGCFADANSNTMVILCSDSVSGSNTLAPEQLEVTLGGSTVPVIGVVGNSTVDIPVSYCCLVDVSGSLNADQMLQAKDTLLGIIASMRDIDNMAIGMLGDDLELLEFTSDKTVLTDIVNSLEPGSSDTNLYAGIVNGIDAMTSNQNVSPNRCIVVLSDGVDDTDGGYTRDEAIRAVSESHIRFYTVAVLRNSSQADNGKSLGEFSRLSPGGKHFVPVIDGTSASSVGTAITASSGSGFIIGVDISGLDIVNRDEMMLRVRSSIDPTNLIEDTMTIYTADLPRMTASPTIPVLPAASAAAAQPEEGSAIQPPVLIASVIAAIILIAAVAATLLIIRKKKHISKSPDPADDNTAGDKHDEESATDQPQDISGVTEDVPHHEDDVNSLNIRMTAIGNTKYSVSFSLKENVALTLGRTSKAMQIINPNDNMLSGVHCSLLYSEGKMSIKDMGSKNGTFLNGVSINGLGSIDVSNDDNIRIGRFEYRINW